tara:strand:+ start:832 stop:1335 length:504 start_codon:yes stop_codon:yes gene_type:complete
LSGSGKTTLGTSLYNALGKLGINNLELLDGDETRKRLPSNFGYSTEDRQAVGMLVANLALESNRKGNIAIVCAISHVRKVRLNIREILAPNFIEVYLDCPVDICADRDVKGHYRKALAGHYDNFVGITEPYQISDNPELVLDTVNKTSTECADILLNYTLKFFTLGK